MPDVARDENPKLRALRDDWDRARDALMAGIYEAMDDGETNARIARSVDWTREYVAKIRSKKPSEANQETGGGTQ